MCYLKFRLFDWIFRCNGDILACGKIFRVFSNVGYQYPEVVLWCYFNHTGANKSHIGIEQFIIGLENCKYGLFRFNCNEILCFRLKFYLFRCLSPGKCSFCPLRNRWASGNGSALRLIPLGLQIIGTLVPHPVLRSVVLDLWIRHVGRNNRIPIIYW